MQKQAMGNSLNNMGLHWRRLGADAPVRFSPVLAGLMTAYSVGASIGWYAIRGTDMGRWLATLGLDKSRLVVLLFWVGVGLFYLGLRFLCAVRLRQISYRTHMTIVGSMLILSLFWLYGRRTSFRFWFDFYPSWGGHKGLLPYYFFVPTSILARVVIPVLLIVFVYKRAVSDFGYRVTGMMRGWWIYAFLTLSVALVVVFYASTLPAFLRKYPWCKPGIIDGTITVQLLVVYLVASFAFYFSGEAFWRGFILFGTTKELGKNGLFFMIMPYVLGHLGKPIPETLGAVAAGLVLGVLAWHHRSFLLGALSHWVIATTMDVAALYRRGIEFIY